MTTPLIGMGTPLLREKQSTAASRKDFFPSGCRKFY
jgi:hypothetical protein